MKNYSSQTLDLLAKILEMSPKQKKIALYFYVRGKLQEKTYPALSTIARSVGCHVDTVCNFLREHKDWVSITFRYKTTNLYRVRGEFFKAMSILDSAGVLNLSTKKQRRWMMNLFKKELYPEKPATSGHENGRIFTPKRPDFHPYSYSYTESSLRSSTTQTRSNRKGGLFELTSERLKAKGLPEGVARYAVFEFEGILKAVCQQFSFYSSQNEVKNKEALGIYLMQHESNRAAINRIRKQRDRDGEIRKSYRL